ncbi:MAG TPA: hypothetical protein K8V16_01140, partial [Rubneribacter badeniensis]|nr:hypothetical protein [Rubneribacter badeniensis]
PRPTRRGEMAQNGKGHAPFAYDRCALPQLKVGIGPARFATLGKVDVGNMTAIVQMHDSGIYANEEVTFDFRKHTESQPVELDRCKPGDEVKVTYFDSQTSKGGLAGESLVLAEATSGL